MLTSKQRAQLKAQGSTLETILIIGKNGLTDNLLHDAGQALRARELVKGRVLETAPMNAMQALAALCAALGAEPVQALGSRFLMYRRNEALHQGTQKTKKKNPVRAGAQARRAAARQERERRNEYFRREAIEKARKRRET